MAARQRMTDDEFHAQIKDLLRRLRRLLDQKDDNDDASGAAGVRAPVAPRGPRPRLDAIAEEMATEILTPEFRHEMRQLIRREVERKT